MTTIVCPQEGCRSELEPTPAHTYRCHRNGHEYVISFTDAHPDTTINNRAPFHNLVLQIDRLTHPNRRQSPSARR